MEKLPRYIQAYKCIIYLKSLEGVEREFCYEREAIYEVSIKSRLPSLLS